MHRTGSFFDNFKDNTGAFQDTISSTPQSDPPKAPSFHSTQTSGVRDDFSLLPASKDVPKILMDPLAVLRQCVRYFTCHPEIYGTNLRALMDREVMQVLRLQSSEAAIAHQMPVTSSHDMATAVEMVSKPLLPPLAREKQFQRKRQEAKDDDLLGYGSLQFTPAKHSFMNLLAQEKDREPSALPESGLRDTLTSSLGPEESLRGAVVVDGNGYEVSFLRRQLQQIEGAYNAKCIRLHELAEENTRLESQLKVTADTSAKWLAKYKEAQASVDALRREAEGWQEKASKVGLSGEEAKAQKSSRASKKRASVASQSSKQEAERMTKLWRETEKSLQECRRSLENSEKEANDTHNHLSDAFLFIERLERRVNRRNRYIATTTRRQRSLEEKYEKLMWCMKELGTLTGAFSFVDFLLSDDPVWTLFVFHRLYCHSGDVYALDETSVISSADHSMIFGRSNGGGRFIDDTYATPIVYRLMSDEATAVTERRGKPKQLRTNLHGAVGCKVVRWENLYCLDFLGGEDNTPNSTEMNKRKLSLLTLASLTQPLRGADGVRLDAYPALPKESKPGYIAKPSKAPQPLVIPKDEGVENSYLYDQSTVRLILRNFWRSRVEQFEATMLRRVTKSIENARRAVANRGVSDFKDMLNAEESEDYAVEETIPNSFLAGLVAFVVQLCSPQKGVLSPADELRLPLLCVRGVSSKDADLWDDGRVFFATVLNAQVRTASVFDEAVPDPPTITTQMRELLCAIYFYTMEYKDTDADFRLFYLVSHQLMPEMIGVNFYACVDAFERDCEAMLKKNVAPFSPDDEAEVLNAEAVRVQATVDEVKYHPLTSSFSPAEAVAKAAEYVDRAPVIGEFVTIEEDSDAEGYGSILPGRREPIVEKSGVFEGEGSPSLTPRDQTVDLDASDIDLTRSNISKSPLNATVRASPFQSHLKHDLLEYLESIQFRRSTQQEEEFQKSSQARKTNEVSAKDPVEPWDKLDHEIANLFGPHASISKEFREDGRTLAMPMSLQSQRQRRVVFGDLHRKALCGARGLLPLEDVLPLLHKHCFSTYAVACCGAPRFFIPCSKDNTETVDREGYFEPFERIGNIPPLASHLKRLRCALALDQSGCLVDYRRLFSTDAHSLCPTHFYDEFLTLTLDYFAQQQNYWMNVVLTSCSARHERFSEEGAEECDGNIPVSSLKVGFVKAFSELYLSVAEAHTFVEHLQQYHELLRVEDDIKAEQFTDAPCLIDSAPIANEVESKEWQFEDEAADCSLLLLALAVRMVFPVWGFKSAVQAKRLSEKLECWTPITRIKKASLVPPIIHVVAPPTPMEEDFRCKYIAAAKRISQGNSGNMNPLRVTARWMAEEERMKTEQTDIIAPEKVEQRFSGGSDRQLENGMLPNWTVLSQVLTKALKAVSGPEKHRPKKVANRNAVEPIEVTSSTMEPIRDRGLYALSRAMGASRSYALKGNTGKKGGKKNWGLPPGLEMLLQFQALHFRNSAAILQASRSLFLNLLPYNGGLNKTVDKQSSNNECSSPDSVRNDGRWQATFRSIGKVAKKFTSSYGSGSIKSLIKKNEPTPLYVEDLHRGLAALSQM